jgi:azurin
MGRQADDLDSSPLTSNMKSNVIARLMVGASMLVATILVHAADSAAPGRVIKIRAGMENAMKFDVASMTAAPGEKITVSLTNASTLPKDVMGHNWILLTAGTDPVAFAAAAVSEGANGYIPSKMKEKIIAFIPLRGPSETGEVTFNAPTAPGQYPFLCSFPAHCLVGMKGVLVVK